MLIHCECGQVLRAPEGAQFVNCPCGMRMAVDTAVMDSPPQGPPPAERGLPPPSRPSGRPSGWKAPGINAPAREGMLEGPPVFDSPDPAVEAPRRVTSRFERPPRTETSRFRRQNEEPAEPGTRTSRFRRTGRTSRTGLERPSRTPLDPPSTGRLGGDIDDIDWGSRGGRRSAGPKPTASKALPSLSGEKAVWNSRALFGTWVSAAIIGAVLFFYARIDASDGGGPPLLAGVGLIALGLLTSILGGLYIFEAGKVSRSLHKMARELKGAVSGFDVYRSFYRTSVLVGCGRAIFACCILAATGMAIYGTIYSVKSGGGFTAVASIITTLFACLMTYLLGGVAMHHANVQAQIAGELKKALQSLEHRE